MRNVWLMLWSAVVFLGGVGPTPLSAQPPQDDAVATRQYSVALGFQRKGIYDKAAQRWSKFIADHPQVTYGQHRPVGLSDDGNP